MIDCGPNSARPRNRGRARKLSRPILSRRAGMKAITVYHPEIVHRTLKIIAAEEGTTVEALTGEAFNLLFRKYQKAEVARGSDDT